MRMALMWGLEPSLHVEAEAAGTNEVCLEVQASGKSSGDWWLWHAMGSMLILWFGLVWFGNGGISCMAQGFDRPTTLLEPGWGRRWIHLHIGETH